jgi:hypothetical protein
MNVARRGRPPDWFEVHPQGTIQPFVSPLATTINGRSAPLGRQPTSAAQASTANIARADS